MSRKSLSSLSDLSVSPVYLSARSAIVMPERAIAVTNYSLTKWLPRLGTDRWCLVQLLRGMCIDSPRRSNGIKRVVASWRYLAECLQVHEETIASWLKHEVIADDKPWRRIIPADDYAEYLSLFIPRLRYAYETENGKTRRVGFLLEVMMEDPIAPEDEVKLTQQVELMHLQQGNLGIDTYRVIRNVNFAQPDLREIAAPEVNRVNETQADLPGRGNSNLIRLTRPQVNPTQSDSLTNVKQVGADLSTGVTRNDSGLPQGKSTEIAHNVNKLKALIIQLEQLKTKKRNYQQVLEPIITLTEELLDDYHSTAMLYKVSRILFPDRMDIYVAALEEALTAYSFDAALNKGAIFVKTLRELADQTNIDLGFRKAGAAPESWAGQPTFAEPVDRQPVFEAPFEEIVWAETLSMLQGQMTKAMFNSVMQNTQLTGKNRGVYVVQVANELAKDWMDNRLKNIVERALSDVIGAAAQVEFRL